MNKNKKEHHAFWDYDTDKTLRKTNKLGIAEHEHVFDMGTTVSLTQGASTDFRFVEAPQTAKSITQLRQERLQQLRQDRIRQRRVGLDITTELPKQKNVIHPQIKLLDESTQNTSQIKNHMSRFKTLTNKKVSGRLSQDTESLERSRIGKASLILTGAFIVSRGMGLLRTSMFASVFGTSHISDAYLQAFLIPDLLFNIVAGGALSSAFIPVFTKYIAGDKDEKTAWHVASSALNLALAIIIGLALIAIIFAQKLVPLYNPGVTDPVELNLIASLSRIMLLQSIMLASGIIVQSILNARDDFLSPAIGTVLYNVGPVCMLLVSQVLAFFGKRDPILAVYLLSWGIVIGAILQVVVQIPGLIKVGMQYSYKAFDWRHPGVKQIGRQMIPRIFNASVLYLSIFVDRSLLSLLSIVAGTVAAAGLITQYNQALQLLLLPLGIFGQTIATAAFPTLAENVAKGRFDRLCNIISETLRSILFLCIPCSIGLVILSLPIVQVLLQHGAYTLADAQATTIPLSFFAIGLTGQAVVEILTRSFYALRDSRTPVIISIGQLILKIALSIVLINVAVWGVKWGMGALALSTSIAGTLEALVLFRVLYQRLGQLRIKELALFAGRVMIAALIMGVALLITRFALDFVLKSISSITLFSFLDTTKKPTLGLLGTFVALIKLLTELFVGIFVYFRTARFIGIEELGPVKRVLNRFKLSWI